jgi:outer membrane protein assembly complex protein YaeT
MPLCAPLGQSFALLAHKAVLGSSALCGAADDSGLIRASEPIADGTPAIAGSYDPEGLIGFDTAPKLDYAAVDSDESPTWTPGAVPAELPVHEPAPQPETTKGPAPSIEQQLSKGGLSVSGGFSSIEGLNAEATLVRGNFRGRNQELSASAHHSGLQTLFELGFADGGFLGGQTLFSATLFSNTLDAAGFTRGVRNSPFSQVSNGVSLRFGRKIAEKLSLTANYRLSADNVSLKGGNSCTAAVFGSSICSALGKRTASVLSLGATLDHRNDPAQPTRGYRLRMTQDLAGLGGATRYARSRLAADGHIGLGGEWVLSLGAEAGVIAAAGKRGTPIFDRFYLGGNSLRGFDLRGVGPRLQLANATGSAKYLDTATGGRTYYAARAELAVPIGGALGRNGIKPVAFVDMGSSFGASKKGLQTGEALLGNSPKPRVAAGIGLAWATPIGSLRIDAAQPIVKQRGDRTQIVSFSVGSSF